MPGSVFDDGILKEDPEEAKKEIEATTSLLTDAPQIVSKAEHPIRYIFYSVWERIKVVSDITEQSKISS